MKHPKRLSIPVIDKSRKKKVEVERVKPEHEQYIDSPETLPPAKIRQPSFIEDVIDSIDWKRFAEVGGLIVATIFIAAVLYWAVQQ